VKKNKPTSLPPSPGAASRNIEPSARPASTTGLAGNAAGASPGRGVVKILLVEDHPDTRLGIQRLLEMAGHHVFPAGSGTQALELASTTKFDVVVSDLGLPDLAGEDLMSQLRHRHGLEGIALSGYGTEEDIERGRQAGFRHHLTKPINFQLLKEMITDLSAR